MGIAAAAATGAPPAGHSGGESIVLVMKFCGGWGPWLRQVVGAPATWKQAFVNLASGILSKACQEKLAVKFRVAVFVSVWAGAAGPRQHSRSRALRRRKRNLRALGQTARHERQDALPPRRTFLCVVVRGANGPELVRANGRPRAGLGPAGAGAPRGRALGATQGRITGMTRMPACSGPQAQLGGACPVRQPRPGRRRRLGSFRSANALFP
jgi:hypothetical protein